MSELTPCRCGRIPDYYPETDEIRDCVECKACHVALFGVDAVAEWNALHGTVQAAPSDRERRLEEALNRIVGLDVRGDDGSNNCEAWAMHLEEAVEISRADLADTTNNDGG